MTLTIGQYVVFAQQAVECYESLRRRARAAGLLVDFRLEDVRALLLNHLRADRRCQYCRAVLAADNFALNPKVPLERGGNLFFHNLIVICKDCSTAKGALDYVEFKELMGLLRSWSPFVQRYLLDRLRKSERSDATVAFACPRGLFLSRGCDGEEE